MQASYSILKPVVCMLGLLACAPVNAASLPLWEAGIGLATLRLPDYRGSDESTAYVLPAPYLVYRGEIFKADRNGIRGLLFDSERVEASLSINGTLPVNSRNNAARSGMANLKPTVELGAGASIHLWRSSDEEIQLDLRVPLRTAITIESSPKQIGWVFSPNINIDIKNPAGLTGWNLGLHTGPLFNSRSYNNYFYSVGAADATAGRPAYSAPGGFAGSQFTMAVSKRFERYWFGAFLRYDSLSGASFADSPLVRQHRHVFGGMAFSWIFGQSATRVEASE